MAAPAYALIVEDDPDAATVAQGMLGVLGYATAIANDGHAALHSLAARPPDLVLLDICLPEMDGVTLVQVARKVRELRETPIVACSAVYPPDSAVAGLLRDLGVHDYLAKPFDLAMLRAAARHADPDGPAGRPFAGPGARPYARAPGRPAASGDRSATTTGASGDRAARTTAGSSEFSLHLDDAVARVRVGGREVPMLIEYADAGAIELRSGEDALRIGDEARASVLIRRAVRDSMQEFDIRIMGQVHERTPGPNDVRYRIHIRVCNPSYGMRLIAEELERSA